MTTSEGRVFDRPRTSSASVNSNFRFRPCDRLHADISRGRGISSLDLITCMLRISTSTFRSGLSPALACTVKRSCMNHCAWTPGRFLDHRRENFELRKWRRYTHHSSSIAVSRVGTASAEPGPSRVSASISLPIVCHPVHHQKECSESEC